MKRGKEDGQGELPPVESVSTESECLEGTYLNERVSDTHGVKLEKELLNWFHALDILERKNVIAALSMFLSAQEESVSDRQSIHGQK